MFTTGQAAGLVGTVDKVDVDEYGEAAGNFLRARVAIPVEKPLKRFITIERRKIDEVYDIQYEKLPFFCFSCGVMGHSKIECLAPNDREQQGKRGYNNSIRAPEEKRKKMQSFSQAAAASDWSGSSARNDSRANSRGQSSEDGGRPPGSNNRVEQEVTSPLKNKESGPVGTTLQTTARALFPYREKASTGSGRKRKTTKHTGPVKQKAGTTVPGVKVLEVAYVAPVLALMGTYIAPRGDGGTLSAPGGGSSSEGIKKQKMEAFSFKSSPMEAANVVQPRPIQ
ncbi:hypothetical protein QYE76_015238 [Lolium multiflorum]|uniref:Zinc knuckle CX2CX4HX4C domain-containing protein n=1 Tax=Lolium multiflorum TaxID=4521 RepID=A0AAD8U280_LOLMU|nr:hypothetical protein QYE76_015238 [Lolium multiflorum]